MKLRTRLQQLERQAAALLAPKKHECEEEEAFMAWYQGGCKGPFPPAGPRPAKFVDEEEWEKHHRFLLAMACVSAGRDMPPGMTEAECREAEDAVAFFDSIDTSGQLSLPARASLAAYIDVIKSMMESFADETASVIPTCGESR